MSESVTVEQQVHFVRGTKGRKHLKSGGQTETPQRVPRIARLMALAIHFDELIRTGKVKDQSELARLGRVSTARISQIMGLLYLAPEIQERLLSLPGNNILEMWHVKLLIRMMEWRVQVIWLTPFIKLFCGKRPYSFG